MVDYVKDQVVQVLPPVTTPETAYNVKDYPYGRRLRCQKRYWLEYSKQHGYRLVTQTTNPKRGNGWDNPNKPKKSTYSLIAGALYIDQAGHIKWSGLTGYSSYRESVEWLELFGAGIDGTCRASVESWIRKKREFEAALGDGRIKFTMGDGRIKFTPLTDPMKGGAE